MNGSGCEPDSPFSLANATNTARWTIERGQAGATPLGGGNGCSTVLVQFVPKLRFANVPEEIIQKILVDKPRRFLAFVPKTV